MRSEHTLVVKQHIVRLADAALPAGGGNFRTDIFAEALWVQAGRQAGGKAVGVEAVVRALQSYRGKREWGKWRGPEGA